MSKIKDLIQQHCPNGVEYKKLGEVCTYTRGVTYNKTKEINNGSYDGWKVLRANNITLENNTINFDDIKIISKDVNVRDNQKLYKDDILICAGSGSKEHIGKVAFISVDMDYIFGGFMGVIRVNNNLLNSRFLFHLLTGMVFKEYLSMNLMSSTINNLNTTLMNNFQIPIPPMEVQEEIVRILDTFSALTAELEAELEARKKQYQYYRDKLLSFENLNGGGYKKLGEIGIFYSGLSGKSKEDFKDGNTKYISYMNVYSNPATNLNCNDYVNIATQERQNAIEQGDILFTSSSETPNECGMSSVVLDKVEEPIYLNSFCFGYRLNDKSKFDFGFLKHIFRSYYLRKQIFKTANGVTRYNVSKKLFAEIEIPIPPMEEQERVVGILDKFDRLVNDISEGIPAEIKARRQQYEYYRDMLLNFKKL